METTRRQLLQFLSAAGLIAGDEARRLDTSPSVGDRDCTSAELIRRMCAGGQLTSFQAQAIREGRIDELVWSNYVLLERIGRGGMGEVFKARHRRMDRIVALKVLHADASVSSEQRQRFRREVQAAAMLSHPHIVAAYDADEVSGRQFLVMEYVDGCDLGRMVEQNGPLSVPAALECLLQIAAGLGYAHDQGVIHRDLKPSNALVDRRGRVKILDLGLARVQDPTCPETQHGASLTTSGQIMGTVDYMAPEQATDCRRVDRRADIYSLGCTFFFLLTGRPVYQGDSLMERLLGHQQQPIPSLAAAADGIPDGLDFIFRRMIAKQREERFESATALIGALEAHGFAAPSASNQLAEIVAKVLPSTGIPTSLALEEREGDPLPPIVDPVRLPALPTFKPGRAPAGWIGVRSAAVVILAVIAGAIAWSMWGRDGSDRPPAPVAIPTKPPDEAPVGSQRETPREHANLSGAKVAAGSEATAPAEAENDPDRRAALRVLRCGGKLEVLVDDAKQIVSSADGLPRERFYVAQVDLGDRPVTDEDLRDLGGLSRLEELALWNTSVTDAGFLHWQPPASLQALHLSGTQVRGAGLKPLIGLRRLELNGTPMDDAGLQHVASLTRLECLYLDDTSVSDAGLETLRPLVHLQELHVERTRVSSEGVARLRAALPACKVSWSAK